MPAPELLKACQKAGLRSYQLDPATKQRRVAKKRHVAAKPVPEPVYVMGPHLERVEIERERWGDVADYERELWG